MTGWTDQWKLVELGPGSGTLMVDILSVLHKLQFDSNLSVHFVEKSQTLIERQKQTFEQRLPNKSIPLHWHNALEEIPDAFTVFVSNEFFDALPIHQFIRSSTNPRIWHEVYVNLDVENPQKFCFMLSPGENIHTRLFVPEHIRMDPSFAQWEYCPAANQTVLQMVDRLTVNGGFALILDYGHDGCRRTHTLRAYKGHALVNPLHAPGHVDLTADVDFGQLCRTVKGKCLVYGPVEQRNFLIELGIAQRVRYLLSRCESAQQREDLIKSSAILVSGDEMGMGVRFKAFSMFPSTLGEIISVRGGCPAGFSSTVVRKKNESERERP